MKALSMTLVFLSVIASAVPAYAGDAGLANMLNATTKDYQTVTACFKEAREDGALSWDEYRRQVGGVVARVSARRRALAVIARRGTEGTPVGNRGLVRMLARDLDGINLSILALVMDERGLSGYMKTGDEGLIKGIDDWREGIRLAIRQSARCIKLAGSITVPAMLPGLSRVPGR